MIAVYVEFATCVAFTTFSGLMILMTSGLQTTCLIDPQRVSVLVTKLQLKLPHPAVTAIIYGHGNRSHLVTYLQ